jgi:hypothetical protein
VRVTAASNLQALIDANPAGTLFVVEAGQTLNRSSALNVSTKNPTIVFLPGSSMVGNAGNFPSIYAAAGVGYTVKGGTFRNFGGPTKLDDRTSFTPQGAGINLPGTGLVEDATFTQNDTGIAVGVDGNAGDAVIRRCKVHGNYRYGIDSWSPNGNGIVIEYTEVTNSNTSDYDNGHDAGGSKFLTGPTPTGTGRIIVRNCWWHANNGSGLWMDYWKANSALPEVYDNVFEDNLRWGFFWEVSESLVFYQNFIKDNEADPALGGAAMAQASVTSADGAAHAGLGIEVHHNDFDMTPQGSIGTRRLWMVRDDGRARCKDVDVHHNRFWLRNTPVAEGGQVGVTGDATTFAEPSIHFDYNLYMVTTMSANLWRWGISGGAVDWATWQSSGHDANGTRQLI